MAKERIEAIIVVEGKSDTQKLQQYYDVDTFETSGTGLREDMLDELEQLAKHRELIIFTDPDVPGEQIRKIVSERFPEAKHAFIQKKEGRSKNGRKLGVEHADFSSIAAALEKAHVSYMVSGDQMPIYTSLDLLEMGLNGYPDSKYLRDKVAVELKLGEVNGKQFLKRLNMFQIPKVELLALIQRLNGEMK